MKLLKIGSNSENDIVINDDDSVSQFHAELFWDGKDILVISDKESTNGTFVNGRRIHDAKRLKELDIVKVGGKLIDWHTYLNLAEKTKNEVVKEKNEKIEKPKKNRWISRYFLFSDNEYLSGGRYFVRTFVQYMLVGLFGLGLYMSAVTSYKRAKSINKQGEGSVMWGIWGFLKVPLIFVLSMNPDLVMIQLIFVTIPHLYLWFSNGNPELKIQS